ncbi:MAG: outer membrane lipoprotein carrier protein LolA [Acidobacteriia bacterium]|nr:outer membrane lipoprotein carrier protein LolA [Terriglobia bacterium]
MRRFEARYRGARSLQAHFLERYWEGGKIVRVDAGMVYFRHPNRMRWEYEAPEVKLFVSDGRTIWFYVPADRTAMRSTLKEDADERTPFALLTGNPRVARLCGSVVLGPPAEAVTPGNQVLHCRLRGTKAAPQAAAEILLEIVPESGDLSRVRVEQGGGAAIEFQFSKWEKNTAGNEAQFHFTPPVGVAIVNAPADGSAAESSLPR